MFDSGYRKETIYMVRACVENGLPKKVMQWITPNQTKQGRLKKTWKERVAKVISCRYLREGQC